MTSKTAQATEYLFLGVDKIKLMSYSFPILNFKEVDMRKKKPPGWEERALAMLTAILSFLAALLALIKELM